MDSFPTNNITFAAAANLTGEVELRRIGEYEFEIFPMTKAIELYEFYKNDLLIFSARLLAKQIGEIKRTKISQEVSVTNPVNQPMDIKI
jgi:hypothetical protein